MNSREYSEISTWGGFVHIHRRRLTDVEISLGLMSEHEQKRAEAYAAETDRQRYIAANTFLRDVLSRYLHKEPAEIVFGYSDFYNKPLLAGDDLHFNLSYRGEWALLGVSDKVIGVDIEKHIVINDMEGFAKNFFSDDEIAEWLNGSNPDSNIKNFFRLWTLKEAYIKAMGKGLSYPLQEFSVIPAVKWGIENSKSSRDFVLDLPASEDGCIPLLETSSLSWGFKELEAPEGYAAAVCYEIA